MTTSTEPTVYVNEDGDLWVVVEDVASFAEARSLALRYAIEQWSQSVTYDGKATVSLTDHEYDCSGIHEEGTCYRARLAYHFVGRAK